MEKVLEDTVRQWFRAKNDVWEDMDNDFVNQTQYADNQMWSSLEDDRTHNDNNTVKDVIDVCDVEGSNDTVLYF